VSRNKTATTVTFGKKNPALHAEFLRSTTGYDGSDVTGITDPQAAWDKFYTVTGAMIDRFYPEKTVTITTSDPAFMTPEIKHVLRCKNKMRSGRIEEATSLAKKVGAAIIKYSRTKLKQGMGKIACMIYGRGSMLKRSNTSTDNLYRSHGFRP